MKRMADDKGGRGGKKEREKRERVLSLILCGKIWGLKWSIYIGSEVVKECVFRHFL